MAARPDRRVPYLQVVGGTAPEAAGRNPIVMLNDGRLALSVPVAGANDDIRVLGEITPGQYTAAATTYAGVVAGVPAGGAVPPADSLDEDLTLLFQNDGNYIHVMLNPAGAGAVGLAPGAAATLPIASAADVTAAIRRLNTIMTARPTTSAALTNRDRAGRTGSATNLPDATIVAAHDAAVAAAARGGGGAGGAAAGARPRPTAAVRAGYVVARQAATFQSWAGVRNVGTVNTAVNTFIDTGVESHYYIPDLAKDVHNRLYGTLKANPVANAGSLESWKNLVLAATRDTNLPTYARLFSDAEVTAMRTSNGASLTNPGVGAAAADAVQYNVLSRLYVKANKIYIHARRPYTYKAGDKKKEKHYQFLDLPTIPGAHRKFRASINNIGLTAAEINVITNAGVASTLVIMKYYLLRAHPAFKTWIKEQGRPDRVKNQVRKARAVADTKRGEVYLQVASKMGTRTNRAKRDTNKALKKVFAATKRQRTDATATCAAAF